MKLPLFPLHAVLYPGATASLHVFEPRYREMVGRCLEHDEAFGIVLIKEGEEVGGPAVPHRVGTEAAIIASQRYRDGRYDLVAEGRRRFEIVSLERTKPYLRAEVRFLEDRDASGSRTLADQVAGLFDAFLEMEEPSGFALGEGAWRELEPPALSYLIASVLPLGEDEKQELLEIPDAETRLRKIESHLTAITRVDARAGAA